MGHMQTERGVSCFIESEIKLKNHMESPLCLFGLIVMNKRGCELTLDSNSLGAN